MKSPLPFAAAALLALAACNSKPETEVIDTNPDPMATQLANAGAIELPPAIKADKSLRCSDNSLVNVRFFEGDKQVGVATGEGGERTMLTAPAAGEPFTAEGGWKLTGDMSNITLEQPGKGSLTCHD